MKRLMPWIGACPVDRIRLGTLQPWVMHRRKEGAATGTINQGLQIVRRILNLAAGEWVDEQGWTWLQAAPKIKLLEVTDKRQPYPLSWREQSGLFLLLPAHLADMALLDVNTGCRDSEVCRLRWDLEVAVPELGTSVFIVPGEVVRTPSRASSCSIGWPARLLRRAEVGMQLMCLTKMASPPNRC